MPTFNTYKKKYANSKTVGEMINQDARLITDATWNDDTDSIVGYFYDAEHDDYSEQITGLNPIEDEKKIPVEIKFMETSNQSYDHNPKTYRIQIRNYEECPVPYYKEVYGDRYDAAFPVGLFIDIADSDGIFNKWMVVSVANGDNLQFKTYDILKCNHVLSAILNGCKYYIPIALRKESSYANGISEGTIITNVSDSDKFVTPLNRITEHFYYDQRLIIDAKVLTEPRCWEISKLNRVLSKGIVNVYLKQAQFNPNSDFIETDENGNIIGMWADYDKYLLKPTEQSPDIDNTSVYGVITYSGTKPEIKIKGSYKKFYINFYDSETNEAVDFENGQWSFLIDGDDVSELILIDDTITDDNQIRIKFIGNELYIEKMMTVKFISESNVETSIDILITSL